MLDEWTASFPASSHLLTRSPIMRGDFKVGVRLGIFRLYFYFKLGNLASTVTLPCLQTQRWLFSNPVV